MTRTEYNTRFSDGTMKVLHGRGQRNITPANQDLTDVALSLYVPTAGNLVVTGVDGTTTTIVVTAAMVAGGGYVHPSAVARVGASTTCTGITATV